MTTTSPTTSTMTMRTENSLLHRCSSCHHFSAYNINPCSHRYRYNSSRRSTNEFARQIHTTGRLDDEFVVRYPIVMIATTLSHVIAMMSPPPSLSSNACRIDFIHENNAATHDLTLATTTPPPLDSQRKMVLIQCDPTTARPSYRRRRRRRQGYCENSGSGGCDDKNNSKKDNTVEQRRGDDHDRATMRPR
ncbi:hypothetical protein EI94DRAFT_955842 [Lactarius quietus]|nr:hypothetical protein EI94DRAFT_955842 [Lactarius quietus]